MGQKWAIHFTLSHLQTIPPAAIPLTFIGTNWWRRYLSLGLCGWLCRHQYRPPTTSLLCLCTSRQAFAPPFPDGTKAWGRLQEELQRWCHEGCYPFCVRSQSNIFHAVANSYVHYLWQRHAAKCTSHPHFADVFKASFSLAETNPQHGHCRLGLHWISVPVILPREDNKMPPSFLLTHLLLP